MSNIRHRKPTTTTSTEAAANVVVNVDDSPPSVSDCESWERSFDDGNHTNGHDDDDDDDISSNPSPNSSAAPPAAPTSTSTTISSLDQFLSTYCTFSARTFTTDQGLKVLQWSLWALSYMTKSNQRNKHLSPSLRKLYLELSFTRYVLRFYGFLQSLEGYRSGSWAGGGAWKNPLIPKIAKYVLAGSMLFYYPLEHVAYIGWQVPQLVPRVNANKFSAISCWFWTVYIVGDFWMNCLKWKELKMKMSDLGERMLTGRTKRGADGGDANDEKENTVAELQNEVLTIRKSIRHIKLQLTRCLLFILPCINWSLPNWATDPLLDEGPLNGLMLAEAYTSVYQSLCSMR
ncbi:hypothetical protein ACHAWU_000824 [Discostella pseudostelligera]|uniref:Uncharacterized protein n=1 Tax=Discostella pseudostelligera TaxID=259834 RepID=A0ABD3MG45_9STRA